MKLEGDIMNVNNYIFGARLKFWLVLLVMILGISSGCASTSTVTLKPAVARTDSPDLLERVEANKAALQKDPEFAAKLRELAIQSRPDLNEGGDE